MQHYDKFSLVLYKLQSKCKFSAVQLVWRDYSGLFHGFIDLLQTCIRSHVCLYSKCCQQFFRLVNWVLSKPVQFIDSNYFNTVIAIFTIWIGDNIWLEKGVSVPTLSLLSGFRTNTGLLACILFLLSCKTLLFQYAGNAYTQITFALIFSLVH